MIISVIKSSSSTPTDEYFGVRKKTCSYLDIVWIDIRNSFARAGVLKKSEIWWVCCDDDDGDDGVDAGVAKVIDWLNSTCFAASLTSNSSNLIFEFLVFHSCFLISRLLINCFNFLAFSSIFIYKIMK
jgi:hypothetical protein